MSKNWIAVLVFLALSKSYSQTPFATQITDVLTDRDSHSYAEYESGKTAEEIIAQGLNFDTKNNTYVLVQHVRDEIGTGHAPIADKLMEIKNQALNSDLIVIATPVKRESALTSSHRFVFSDYELYVDKVYKSRFPQITAGSTIVLTRPGGEVLLGQSTIRGIEPELPLFHLREQYLFFLYKSSESGSFKTKFSGCFLISNGQIHPARLHPLTSLSSAQLDSAIEEVEGAVREVKP